MKLKHRIAGTILAIVFATTSALPAATIPQLKSPPKAPAAPKVAAAPKVPVVKVPVAPKVPVVPKVVSAPKVPVVKVPVAPKIPQIAKVPSVKAPVAPKMVKVPEQPKIPNAPKLVKTPAAPKIPQTKVQIQVPQTKIPSVAKAPASPSQKSSKNTPAAKTTTASPALVKRVADQNIVSQSVADIKVSGTKLDPIKSIVRDARKDNPESAPDIGVDSKIPGNKGLPDRSLGSLLGGARLGESSGKTSQEVLDVRSGKGGTVKGIFDGLLPERGAIVLQEAHTRPAFDQGFAAKPSADEVNQAGAAAGLGQNPVTFLTGGGLSGPLADAASRDAQKLPGKGGAVGSGMVADEVTSAVDGAVSHVGAVAGGAGAVLGVGSAGVGGAATLGGSTLGAIGAAGGSALLGAGAAVGGAAAAGYSAGRLLDMGTDAIVGAAAAVVGSNITDKADVAVAVADFLTNPVVGPTVPVKTTPGTGDEKATPPPAPGGAKKGLLTPDPENTQGRYSVYDLSPGILQQIGQARSGGKVSQGGSGDATPVDNGGMGGVVTGGKLPGNVMQNLVGTPVDRGLREGGAGRSGPDFNGTAGQINLGPDSTTTTAGGRTEDPGDFFGDSVSPNRPINSPASGSSSNDDSADDDTGSSASSSKDTKKKK